MSDSEDDKIDIEYEQFLANRESLLSLARHNIGLFDKSILAMSSGVFGLSILFAERLGGFGIVNAKYLLAYAWIALALSISGQISSYWFAWKDATREIQKQDSSFSKNKKYDYSSNVYRKITINLNILSFLLFLFGIFFICRFVFINLDSANV